MANETVVKDPTKKSFWHFRNILLITMTAGLPAFMGWAWNKSSDAVTAYLERQKVQESRIKLLEEKIKRDMDNREEERASDKAIWSAIAEERAQITQQEINIRVLQKLYDREHPVTHQPAPLSTTPGPTPADQLPEPPAPVTPPKPSPTDQLKNQQKHLFPQEQQKK
jgi:hypothetical protein